MSLPWASMARTVQLYTDLPLRMTVQAPQVARSQTRLAPVSSRSLRSASSSVTRGSRLRVCGLPLILSVMGTAPGPMNLPSAAGAASALLSSIPAPRTPPPMPAPGDAAFGLAGNLRIVLCTHQTHSFRAITRGLVFSDVPKTYWMRYSTRIYQIFSGVAEVFGSILRPAIDRQRRQGAAGREFS